MIPAFRDAWPTTLNFADEWAGEEWLEDLPSSWQNHRTYGGTLASMAEYSAEDSSFLQLYREVLSGERSFDDASLLASAERLHVVRAPTGDRRYPPVAPLHIDDALLSDIAEDYVPDVPMLAGDRWLGPWADERPSRALLRVAAAGAAFLPVLDDGQSPMQRWEMAEPPPPAELRASVRAASRAPPNLWRVEADGCWTPLSPIAAHFQPTGPVLAEIVPISGPTRVVVGRAVPRADGRWMGLAALGLPEPPPARVLARRLKLEMWRLLRHERRATWEDLLRRRSEVLYRTCATWCWLRTEDR